MRVLFIASDFGEYINNSFDSRYHFGLAYLISHLKKEGHTSEYFYYHSLEQIPAIIQMIKKFDPGLIGFTITESQWPYLRDLATKIKQETNKIIICGGSFPTLAPEEVCQCSSIDGVLIGEGELALSAFIRLLERGDDWRKAPNLCYFDHTSKMMKRNDMLPLINDLDRLPFPDRQYHIESDSYDSFVKKESVHVGYDAVFSFSRGCPFKCTYCSTAAMCKAWGKTRALPRLRSPNNCLEEIGQVLELLKPVKPINMMDDIFTANKEWLFEFLEGYKKKFRKKFAIKTRIEAVDEQVLIALKEAGCYSLAMSVECGNEKFRRNVLKRNVSNATIYEAFRTAHRIGLETVGAVIIGCPGETKEMIEETISMVAALNTKDCYVGVFYPYKGTPLYHLCKEMNLLPKDYAQVRRRAEPVINLPDLSKDELMSYYDNWKELVIRRRPFLIRNRYYLQERLNQIRHYLYLAKCRMTNQPVRRGW